MMKAGQHMGRGNRLEGGTSTVSSWREGLRSISPDPNVSDSDRRRQIRHREDDAWTRCRSLVQNWDLWHRWDRDEQARARWMERASWGMFGSRYADVQMSPVIYGREDPYEPMKQSQWTQNAVPLK
ncbi:MAG TPA: hypothetical protein VFV38_30095 [Ktedonobacteraceae bacterium]|nr:hypothetical protein [Ktedonobacteraceae bacterium]